MATDTPQPSGNDTRNLLEAMTTLRVDIAKLEERLIAAHAVATEQALDIKEIGKRLVDVGELAMKQIAHLGERIGSVEGAIRALPGYTAVVGGQLAVAASVIGVAYAAISYDRSARQVATSPQSATDFRNVPVKSNSPKMLPVPEQVTPVVRLLPVPTYDGVDEATKKDVANLERAVATEQLAKDDKDLGLAIAEKDALQLKLERELLRYVLHSTFLAAFQKSLSTGGVVPPERNGADAIWVKVHPLTGFVEVGDPSLDRRMLLEPDLTNLLFFGSTQPSTELVEKTLEVFRIAPVVGPGFRPAPSSPKSKDQTFTKDGATITFLPVGRIIVVAQQVQASDPDLGPIQKWLEARPNFTSPRGASSLQQAIIAQMLNSPVFAIDISLPQR